MNMRHTILAMAAAMILPLAACSPPSPSTAPAARSNPTSPSTSEFSKAAAHSATPASDTMKTPTNAPTQKLALTEAQWKERLTPEQYEVLRQKGTERAFTGKYWNTKEKGVYKCAGCGEILFTSDSKFDSGWKFGLDFVFDKKQRRVGRRVERGDDGLAFDG